MIYVTGDTHADFSRFTKKSRWRTIAKPGEGDFVIVCGDFGLLWARDKEFDYSLDWMSRLPFTILWVQGNHENYDMIAEYPIEEWKGGKVRKILSNIILLERGQVFTIEGKTFFTFGGASSHDVQGGIFDVDDPDYREQVREANRNGLPYRVNHLSWWEQELPSEEEMQEGRENLEKVVYKIDYVITHCISSGMQDLIMGKLRRMGYLSCHNESDRLTDYFSELEQKLQYRHWYFGHYHFNERIDPKHTVLYETVISLGESTEESKRKGRGKSGDLLHR